MPLATILGVCFLLGLSSPGRLSVPAYAVVLPLQGQDSSTTGTAPAENPAAPAQQKSETEQKPLPNPGQSGSNPTAATPASTNSAPARQGTKSTHPKRKAVRKAKKKPSSVAASKSQHKGNSAAPADAPDTVVVPNGGAGDPKVQLSPEVPRQQVKSQRKNVDQLLASTDANLKALSARQLNSDQQDMVRQIRMYMEQAKQAAAASDLQRAHNLALKASLLADEMVKH
jgi:hypothetical protein